jgi:hypothetical protein
MLFGAVLVMRERALSMGRGMFFRLFMVQKHLRDQQSNAHLFASLLQTPQALESDFLHKARRE